MDGVFVFLLIFGGVALLLFRAVRSLRRGQLRHLPKSFDFDEFKAREITARGVFDKTKWR
jgi:hypothetical protein